MGNSLVAFNASFPANKRKAILTNAEGEFSGASAIDSYVDFNDYNKNKEKPDWEGWTRTAPSRTDKATKEILYDRVILQPDPGMILGKANHDLAQSFIDKGKEVFVYDNEQLFRVNRVVKLDKRTYKAYARVDY